MNLYILDGHEPKPVEDMLEWGRLYQIADNRVGYASVGPYQIFTTFVGRDHNLSDHGPPLLFETAAFIMREDDIELAATKRCCTWDEAVAQHQKIVDEMTARAYNQSNREK